MTAGQDWIPLSTSIANTASVMITDPDATNCPSRCYRVAVR
jgi:hypothetical protein